MLILGNFEVIKDWLLKFFNENPDDSYTFAEICRDYFDWRENLDIPPLSRFEHDMSKRAIYHLLEYDLHEENFISKDQPGGIRSQYYYSKIG